MACNVSEGLGDDFFEQILAVPEASYGRSMNDVGSMMPMELQLGSTKGGGGSLGIRVGMPLGLNLEQGVFMRNHGGGDSRGFSDTDDVEGSNGNNHNHHQQLLCLNHNAKSNNNSTSSSPSSTAGINDKDMQMRGMVSGFGKLHNSTPTPTHAHFIRPMLLSTPLPPQPQRHHHLSLYYRCNT